MAQVTVSIDGKSYRMACDEGQEPHLLNLAALLDRHVTDLKGSFGEIGDQRLTVMAGIMIADQLTESESRLKSLQSRLEQVAQERDSLKSQVSSGDGELAQTLTTMTKKLDEMSQKLARQNQPPAEKQSHTA